jgi:AbrB family looped-hinge helix DNA binding protein
MSISKSVKLSRKGQFVIPKEIREGMGVEEGDELLITLEGERAILTRPEQHAKATRGLLKGTWGRTKSEVARYIDKERRSWR